MKRVLSCMIPILLVAEIVFAAEKFMPTTFRSFVDLISDPERLSEIGGTISVVGYLSDDAMMLYLTKQHALFRDLSSAVVVRPPEEEFLVGDCVGKYVQLEGVFGQNSHGQYGFFVLRKVEIIDAESGFRLTCWSEEEYMHHQK